MNKKIEKLSNLYMVTYVLYIGHNSDRRDLFCVHCTAYPTYSYHILYDSMFRKGNGKYGNVK